MLRSSFLLGLFILMLAGIAGNALAGGRNPEGLREPLAVERGRVSYAFEVEVVHLEADRNRGLMFRKSMAAAHGMLFDFDPPRPVSFWMKNTHIPLDIIFIDADGRIIRIAENTVPFSLDPVPSGEAARGVLEINAGLSRKLGLKPGDRVRHRIFGNLRGAR
jgi:uncharacterized membrane protein (UPF0127 family)